MSQRQLPTAARVKWLDERRPLNGPKKDYLQEQTARALFFPTLAPAPETDC
ncbi:hypothetical protein [Pseudomonas atagonensis]|uniref:hypothetical protein n=1 Tax=Pseudomonas atagonensis TaxID=2609964 RepID=UPI00140DD2A3|nr:hypothetical protein [Pseudomonas atagonensis]